MNLTIEQQKIVDSGVCNLLVSAAAGSGKTTVMVEHIIHLLLDEQNPVYIDDLLVVTFTEAAALSMKNKINDALLARCRDNPENAFLKEQLRRLPLARICTIDAFLLSVVEDNITMLDELDSSLRLMDPGEEDLLFKEVLKNVLEDNYLFAEKDQNDTKNKRFITMVDYFTPIKSDVKIEESIKTIYQKIMNFASPMVFLKQSIAKYEDPLTGYRDLWLDSLNNKLWECEKQLQNIQAYFELNSIGEEKYLKDYALKMEAVHSSLEKCRQILKQNRNNESIDLSVFKNIHLEIPDKPSLQHKKVFGETNCSIELWKKLKNNFTEFNNLIDICNMPKETALTDFQNAILGLSEFIKDFNRKYSEEKSRKNVVSFNDISHYALRLLFDDEECEFRSMTALDYQKQFKAVFVDEYQDVNDMQNKAIEAVSDGHNLFMVGDVKQSIYRFRSSLPELFLKKHNTFIQTEEPSVHQDNLMILNQNFRSHPDILNVTNQFFNCFLNLPGNQLNYQTSEHLNAGLPVDKFSSDAHAHVQLIDLQYEEEKVKRPITAIAEAKWIARDIKEKLDSQYPIFDLETVRPIQKKDIVVLMRTNQEFNLLAKELTDLGIESVRDKGYNFYDAPEIQLILALLKVLDNPLNNIELIQVLHSVIFNFTAQDLADLRLLDPEEKAFYNLLVKAADNTASSLNDKCLLTLQKIIEWTKSARYLSIHDLLVMIYREEDLYLYYKAMPYGDLRVKNLDLLLEKSLNFEKTIFNGLYSFLGYLEMNKRNQETMEEASTTSDHQDAVRLMTIHKSKGLEFPLVYLADLDRCQNKQEYKTGILVDRNLGIGIKPNIKKEEPENLYGKIYSMFNYGMQKDILSERECLLYVAMTRAIDTLVMVLNSRPENKPVEEASSALDLQKLDSYSKWIRSYTENNRVDHLEIKAVPVSDIFLYPSNDNDTKTFCEKDAEMHPEGSKMPSNSVKSDLLWIYPFGKETALKVRFSVSEIKKASEEYEVNKEEEIPEPEQSFFANEGINNDNKGAKRGTAFHLFMANADFDNLFGQEDMERQIQILIERDLITEQEANEYVDRHLLTVFAQSDLCQRLRKAREIHREQPFILSLSLKELKELCPSWSYLELGNEKTEVMLQGIIDCFFIEDGQIVLIDYKTDKVLDNERKAMYQTQLKIYEKALEKGGFGRVKEKGLYWAKDGRVYNF